MLNLNGVSFLDVDDVSARAAGHVPAQHRFQPSLEPAAKRVRALSDAVLVRAQRLEPLEWERSNKLLVRGHLARLQRRGIAKPLNRLQ